MGSTRTKILTLLSTGALLLAVPASALAATDLGRAEGGLGYIASRQKANGSIPAFSPIGSTADAVLAAVAVGQGRGVVKDALGYLSRQVETGKVDGVGLRAKVVLAVSAAGRDPRAFGGTNLVAALRGTISGGRFGTAAVFDDALATLALESAGLKPSLTVTDWLRNAQCPDGGWAYDEPYSAATDDGSCYDGTPGDYFTSDSNTTSYVVQALEAANRATFVADPFAFFDSVRDDAHGGWSYSAGFIVTDANSTALVLQAYAAAGGPVPAGGRTALRALQHQRCGAWAYSYDGAKRGVPDVGATIGAVPGLLLKPLPFTGPVIGPIATAIPACVSPMRPSR
jgi:hypothetical protein